jgi:hypothetical protein
MIHTIAASHHCVNAQWVTDRAEMARLHGKQLIVLNTTSPSPSIFSRASREACYAVGEAVATKMLEMQIEAESDSPSILDCRPALVTNASRDGSW